MRKWQCTKCGSKNKGKAKFCLNCGNPFMQEETVPEGTVQENPVMNEENTPVVTAETSQAETAQTADVAPDAVIVDESALIIGADTDGTITKSSKKKKVIIICTVTGFVLIAAALVYLFVFSGIFGKDKEKEYLFDDDRLVYLEDGKYGYIDSSGKIAIEAEYDGADAFSNGLAPVKSEDLYGYIDTDGKVVIDFQFDQAYGFSKYGYAVVESDEKQGIIDKEGKYVLDPDYDRAYQVSKDRFIAGNQIENEDGGWTRDYRLNLYDEKGNKVCAAEFTSTLWEFKEGLLQVCNKSGKYGYINEKGEYKIDAKFDGAGGFSEGLASVTVKKGKNENDVTIYKYGYIDKSGEIVINAEYDSAYDFSDGLAAVEKDGKHGYINKKGETVIDFEYDTAFSFKDGHAVVGYEKNEDEWDYVYGLIDKNGKQTISMDYDDITYGNSMYLCEKDGEYQYLTEEGKSAVNGTYYRASKMYDDGYAIVANGDKRFVVIDDDGKEITDTDYEGLGYYDSSTFCKIEDCYNSSTYSSSEGYCEKHYKEYEDPYELDGSMWSYYDYLSSDYQESAYLHFNSQGKGTFKQSFGDLLVDPLECDFDILWRFEDDKIFLTYEQTGHELGTLELTDENNGTLIFSADPQLKLDMERFVSDDDDDYDY